MTDRIHTGEILEVLKQEDVKKAVEDSMKIFEAELVNYTPVMPGDFDTKTFHCEDPNNEKTCRPAGIPLAQQLRGRMRWLARLVIAGLEGCNADTYKQVEEECFKVKLKLDRGEIEMGLIEFMFGTLNARNPRNRVEKHSFTSPFKLQVEYSVNDSAKMWREDYVRDNLSGQVRKILPKRRRKRRLGNIEVEEEKLQLIDRYHALLSRKGREGRENFTVSVEPIERAPIEPGKVLVRVRVFIEPHVSRLNGEISGKSLGEALKPLSALYPLLAVASFTIFGVGKGANRGFGRFRLTSYWYKKDYFEVETLKDTLEGILDKIKALSNYTSQGLNLSDEESLRKLEGEVRNHVNSILEGIITIAAGAVGSGVGARLKCIPSLWVALTGDDSQNLYGLKVVKAGLVSTGSSLVSVNDSIEVIARAVLKQSWKGRNFRNPGLPYHTWLLGLPRASNIDCTCASGASARRRVRYGYYVLSDDTAKALGVNACLPSEKCCGPRAGCISVEALEKTVVNVGVRSFEASNVRRQSMFIIFPLPGDHSLIAIVPLYSLDMDLINAGVGCFRNLRLYHVGGHFADTRPCCNAHAVDVSFALATNSVPMPGVCGGPCGKCGCGQDNGGVNLVRASGARGSGSNPYYDIVWATYFNVEECLRRGC